MQKLSQATIQTGKKIGIDCRIFSSKFTGLGRYTHELVEHFIELNSRLKNPYELILFFNDPEYKSFKLRPHVSKILVNAKHYSLSEQTTFLKKLLKEKLDLMFFPHFNVPILYNRPFVVTIHDLILNYFPGRKMTKFHHRLGYNLTIKHALKKSKKIISVSENTKADILKFFKIPKQKISVIYNGLSPEFKPSKNQTKKPFLLYTGVWRNHKNLPRLIEAFDILQQKIPELKLIITGKEDPFYPEVRKTIKSLKLQDKIITPGLVDEKELLKLYQEAAIYVFPSLYEGFGLPPLEAMSCATPVAASNTSSIPEIAGKNNAVYFDPYNVQDIADKIYKLYANKNLSAELVKNGLEHVKNFSWEKTAKETFKLLTDV
ncbi:MAG: glycosyltransferase family 1 protein [Patescibacteria group bacterium]|mgnify:CR=1 FL=1